MKSIIFSIQCFLNGKRIIKKQEKNLKNVNILTRGHIVDEIELQVTLTSRQEIDDLINFLQISKHSFNND